MQLEMFLKKMQISFHILTKLISSSPIQHANIEKKPEQRGRFA